MNGELVVFGIQITPTVILLMIMGLVEVVKKFKVQGNVLTAVSMVVGIAIGVLFQLAIMFPEWVPWLQVGIGGLIFGLAASGVFDLAKYFTGK